MEYKNLSRIKSYCIKLKKDDEFIKSLTSFCIHNKITSGFFEAIGATDNLSIGWFDINQKKYVYKDIKRSMEILSLVGNVSLIDGVPFIHAHICVSDNTFSIIGGHVKSCIISLTCEIYLQSYYPKIHRIKNEKLGISTLNLKVS